MMAKNRIKELRKEKGLTQVELAKALNVSKGAIAMWETGKRTPTFEYLRPMSMLFNRDPDYILCYTDDASPIPWVKREQTIEETSEQSLWFKSRDLEESIRRYSELDEYGRKAVDYLLSCEHNRCEEQGMLFDVSNLVFSVEIKVKPAAEELDGELEESEPDASEDKPKDERDLEDGIQD
ncbi:MAG: helix-turn-helix transcriptional regulator [Oscillospiraceae bacterium]|nr:helix-turn-helix transcriptional regulator [Oscillospiraceae bacterium]MBP5168433.1 helix-turn-helix transcriptional regulator [Oscillospiraceae bacterium]